MTSGGNRSSASPAIPDSFVATRLKKGIKATIVFHEMILQRLRSFA